MSEYRSRTGLLDREEVVENYRPETKLPKDDEPKIKRRSGWRLSPFVRVRIAAAMVTLLAMALIANLFHWQVQQGQDLSKRAQEYHLQTSAIPARRGLIYDSNGVLMASNILVYKVWASPVGLKLKQEEKTATKLAEILPNVPIEKIRDALTDKNRKDWVHNLIAKEVDAVTADKIRLADLDGITLESESRRLYPNGTSGAHILGFANYLGEGNYGVEGKYDGILAGKPGELIAERDAAGDPIVFGSQKISNAVDGSDLTLTLDLAVQSQVEKELLKGMFDWKASKAMAIVMNPQTGAIISYVSYPDYDPNKFPEYFKDKASSARLTDPLVSQIYEPGSTFKVLTAAIGIDTGTIQPTTNFGDQPGCIIRYSNRICNYDSQGLKNLTPELTLQKSSNVGAIMIGEKYGPKPYYEYLQKFGIGKPTGFDVQGEVPGLVRAMDSPGWSMLDFDNNVFGQAIAVTPMQLVTAISAVANGGKVMKPYVVSQVSRDGKVISTTQPTVVGQAISPESAKITTEMLVKGVKNGETKLAGVKGYKIAGKTGTAQKALPGGGYDPNNYIGSVVAYAPADNPQFLVYVRLDDTKPVIFGSNTAGPVVSNIMEYLFKHYNIPPSE